VDTSAVAGGFVLPNSRVDIVWVLRRGNDAETTAKVLLQNVLVLAVGTIHQRPDDKQALLESTVTLAVTPEQAEKLTLAQEMGTLRLILRPFNDDELVKTSGVNPKNIGKTGDKASEDATGPDQIEDILSAPKADAWGQDKNALPQLPATPAPAPVPAPAEVVVQNDAPKTFTMMIHNGSATRRIRFAIQDENSETIGEEIRASTLPDRPAPAPKMETSTGSDK
jgi:Flp pilus assembly protein CpaB